MEWGAIAAIGVGLIAFVWRRSRRAVTIDVGPLSNGWLAEQKVSREGWRP
jgi:hypothetical protein